MFTKTKLIFLALTVIASASVAFDAYGERYNPTTRSLNKMARRGNPMVSMQALGDVCPSVKTVTGSEFLWKAEISDHISKKDNRATGPTFICNRLCPTTFPMNFYYSDGIKAGSVGYYGVYRATGKARAYCAVKGARKCYIKRIAANTKLSGRDGYLYLKLSDSTCYRVNPLGRTGRP